MSKLTEDRVEQILREHHRAPDDPDVAALERIAIAHSGAATEAEAKAAADELRARPELAETLLTLSALEARAIIPPLGSKTSTAGYKTAAAIVGALAASIAIVAINPLEDPATSSLSPKGPVGELALAVEREGRRFTARPGDLLLPGDRLGLFYSAAAPGHLAIFHRDQASEVTALFPANARASAAIEPGVHIAVPDGAIVEEGTGCEWFIAVFSDRPMSMANLSKVIASGAGRGAGCSLSVDIPDARIVCVFEVQRSQATP